MVQSAVCTVCVLQVVRGALCVVQCAACSIVRLTDAQNQENGGRLYCILCAILAVQKQGAIFKSKQVALMFRSMVILRL